jgi:hypothetical protein
LGSAQIGKARGEQERDDTPTPGIASTLEEREAEVMDTVDMVRPGRAVGVAVAAAEGVEAVDNEGNAGWALAIEVEDEERGTRELTGDGECVSEAEREGVVVARRLQLACMYVRGWCGWVGESVGRWVDKGNDDGDGDDDDEEEEERGAES